MCQQKVSGRELLVTEAELTQHGCLDMAALGFSRDLRINEVGKCSHVSYSVMAAEAPHSYCWPTHVLGTSSST